MSKETVHRLQNMIREHIKDGNYELIILMGDKEFFSIKNGITGVPQVAEDHNTFEGFPIKMLHIRSALEVMSIESYKVLMTMQKIQLAEQLARTNTLMDYIRWQKLKYARYTGYIKALSALNVLRTTTSNMINSWELKTVRRYITTSDGKKLD